MKYVALAIALGFAAPAFATETELGEQQNAPVLMTDAQLDEVVAGQCTSTFLCVNDINVSAQVPVTVQANVLANVCALAGACAQGNRAEGQAGPIDFAPITQN